MYVYEQVMLYFLIYLFEFECFYRKKNHHSNVFFFFFGNFYLQDTEEGNSQDKPLYLQQQEQQQYIDSYLLSQVKGVKYQEEEKEVTLKNHNKNNKQ